MCRQQDHVQQKQKEKAKQKTDAVRCVLALADLVQVVTL